MKRLNAFALLCRLKGQVSVRAKSHLHLSLALILVSFSIGVVHAQKFWNVDFKRNPPQQDPTFYSNFEGHLDESHQDELKELSEKYFISPDGQVDLAKLPSTIEHFQTQRRELEPTMYMHEKDRLINKFFLDDKEASKKAKDLITDEGEVLHALDILVANTQRLLEILTQNPMADVQDLLADTVLVASLCETKRGQHIFRDYKRALGAVIYNFHRVPIEPSDDRPEASNLYFGNRFLKPQEVKALRNRGTDLSRIDPPNSAFWSNNKIEEYDPRDELFMGQELFPPEGARLQFKRFGKGTIKIKANWITKNKKGKKIKASVTVKTGKEKHSAIVASQLARAVGYPAVPMAHRRFVTLELGDEDNYDSFVAKWSSLYGFDHGSPLTHIEKYDPTTNSVTLRNITYEVYPDDKDTYRKLGSFAMGHNGYHNRREFRGLLAYQTLISLLDAADRQVRADAIYDKRTDRWRPVLHLNDTGYSIGSFLFFNRHGALNDMEEKIASRQSHHVRLNWIHTGYPTDTFRKVTYADMQWISRRYGRLSAEQLRGICDVSGYPAPAAALCAEKLKARINSLTKAFQITPNEFPSLARFSDEELHLQFPEYIAPSGRLAYKAEDIENTTASLFGPSPNKFELIEFYGYNFLQDQLSGLIALEPDLFKLNTAVSLGEHDLQWGFKIGGNRTLAINHEDGTGHHRFLVKDDYTLSIPMGYVDTSILGSDIKLETPIAVSYVYTYTYFHSHQTIGEAVSSTFFQNMNPFALGSIRENLTTGEVLQISHRFAFSIGTIAAKVTDAFSFNVSLLGFRIGNIQDVYIARPTESQYEIVRAKSYSQTLRTGVDVTAYVKLALGASRTHTNVDYEFFRLNAENLTSTDKIRANTAFRLFLLHNDTSQLDSLASKFELKADKTSSEAHGALLFWSWAKAFSSDQYDIKLSKPETSLNEDGSLSSISEVQAPDQIPNAPKTVYVVKRSAANELTFSGLWDQDVFDPGAAKGLLNLFGVAFDEGTSSDHRIELVANSEYTGFEEQMAWFKVLRADQWATRDEYQEDFVEFFNRRADYEPTATLGTNLGDPKYITLKLPKSVDYLSPLFGTMTWQMGEAGMREVLMNLKESVSPLCDDRCQIRIERFYTPVSKDLPLEKRKATLRKKAEDLSKVLWLLSASEGRFLGQIRNWATEKNYWLSTSLNNPLELTVPLVDSKGILYWAPEVGMHPGFSFFERFRQRFMPYPFLDFMNVRSHIGDPFSTLGYDGVRDGGNPFASIGDDGF